MNPFQLVSQHLNERGQHTPAGDCLTLLCPLWAGEQIPDGVARQIVLDRLADEEQTPLVMAMRKVVNQMPGLDFNYVAP